MNDIVRAHGNNEIGTIAHPHPMRCRCPQGPPGHYHNGDEIGFSFKKMIRKVGKVVKKIANNPLVKMAVGGIALVFPVALPLIAGVAMASKVVKMAGSAIPAKKAAALKVIAQTKKLAATGHPEANRALDIMKKVAVAHELQRKNPSLALAAKKAVLARAGVRVAAGTPQIEARLAALERRPAPPRPAVVRAVPRPAPAKHVARPPVRAVPAASPSSAPAAQGWFVPTKSGPYGEKGVVVRRGLWQLKA